MLTPFSPRSDPGVRMEYIEKLINIVKGGTK